MNRLFSTGLVLAVMIIALFFIVYMFFRDENYYRLSIVMNAFVLPLLLGIGGFISVKKLLKQGGFLTFKMVYRQAFIPIFVGGTVALFFIFSFINYVDKDVKIILNQQYIESFRQSLEEEYEKAKQIVKPNSQEDKELETKYAEGKVRIAEKINRNEDMFSGKYFMYIYAGYCAFFLIISLFFASFFRSRRPLS